MPNRGHSFFSIPAHDKIKDMKRAKSHNISRAAGALLISFLICAVAHARSADLYLDDTLVYSCRDFRTEDGVVFLPLAESGRALGMEVIADPQSKMIFFRHQNSLAMIDSGRKQITVIDTVVPLTHAPLWSDGKVYIPQEVFTQMLSGLMGAGIRIENSEGPDHEPAPEKNGKNTPPGSALRNPVDVIVIDPGHGGSQAGAKGPGGMQEKDVTLQIAKKLQRRLQKEKGVTVHLTRSEDTTMSLSDRPGKARELSADVFISIHANGFKRISAQGFETFFASLTATDEAALELANWENRTEGEEEAPSDVVKNDLEMILGDMAQTESLADSQRLAEMIQKELALVMKSDNRGVKQAPFRVLMDSTMPAVLVEVGFITSPAEARMITDPQTQEKIVGAIADAILEYQKQTNARLGLETGKGK